MTASKTKDGGNATEKPQAGLRGTWEYRSGRFVLRIVAALFFLSYLSAAAPAAWTWGWAAFYKSQPASRIDRLIEENIARADQSKLLAWIQRRPPEERLSIEEKIAPHTATANSFVFLMFSDWALERQAYEQALFWNFYARYRLRFDALRCGAPNSVMNMKGIVALVSNTTIEKIVEFQPGIVPFAIQQVLDYDAMHPADNDPAGVCKFIHNLEKGSFLPVRRENWPALRHTLRTVTEYSLRQMQGGGAADEHPGTAPQEQEEDRGKDGKDRE
jgi:hypothetical protein